jgi:hypothetical protein
VDVRLGKRLTSCPSIGLLEDRSMIRMSSVKVQFGRDQRKGSSELLASRGSRGGEPSLNDH